MPTSSIRHLTRLLQYSRHGYKNMTLLSKRVLSAHLLCNHPFSKMSRACVYFALFFSSFVCLVVTSDAVQFLSGEGHLYSTIDDDHYRSTET